MRPQFTILLLAWGRLGPTVPAVPADNPKVLDAGIALHEGLVYWTRDPELTLDLFLPRPSEKPVPCVLVIQGGGFKPQNGGAFRPFAIHLAENGFAAAVISYQGRPEHTYPRTVSNTKAAVRFIRTESRKYGIDADRIGAMGRSAGGTLAVLLAVTGGVEALEGDGGNTGISSRIQAAVGISGVYDFVSRFQDPEQLALQPRWELKRKTNGEWIGSPFAPGDEHWLHASAVRHVDPQDPPILFLHSKNDRTVPWIQSRDMYAAMRTAGIGAKLVLAETGGHGGPPDTRERMVAFFKQVLVDTGAAGEGIPNPP